MNFFKNILFALAISAALLGCEKEKEVPACVGPVKITFQNTRAYPVRMEMATAFDAQNNPINPLFVIELPAFGTAKREYTAGAYIVHARKDCAASCVLVTSSDARYVDCQDVTLSL
jgi:hypothetical protein